MFKKYRFKNRIQADISMTPMIDIVFQLLAFFMITSTFIQTSSLNIDLPKAKASDISVQQNSTLIIQKNGTLIWKEKPISAEELPKTLNEFKSTHADAALIIQGDEDIPYGLLVSIMDAAKLAGIDRLSLATVLKK
ncbi:biopolymer transport protein ExbD [Brevinema andersonii]|uniref:Biopolymer transport protein ExbD n=1 Tax=Brevinema andersonii TaxID=34097 RepID=A0A1I1ETD8_BREAD|nr:biopolymer transporter ExbD [Brevinema andersonii]SFB90399.1 biopolymer transport protein ExbD [Brevinema andersonii]